MGYPYWDTSETIQVDMSVTFEAESTSLGDFRVAEPGPVEGDIVEKYPSD